MNTIIKSMPFIMELWLSIFLVAIVLLIIFVANPFSRDGGRKGHYISGGGHHRSGGGGTCSSDTCGI